MALTVVKRRREVVNGRRKTSSALRRPTQRTRRNMGEIVTVGLMGNPARRETKSVAKTKKKSGAKRPHKRRTTALALRRSGVARTNGLFRRGGAVMQKRRRSRRNPPIVGTVTSAAWAILGAIGSRLVTQMALGSKNTGVMGYAANAGVSAALYLGAKHLVKDERAANMVLLGATIGLLLRAMQDFTPFGQYAQLSGLGDYTATTFFVPAVPVNPQSGTTADMLLPASITSQISAAKAALMASANAAKNGQAMPARRGMGSLTDGIGGRYGSKGRYS